jgi:hypothetical protein
VVILRPGAGGRAVGLAIPPLYVEVDWRPGSADGSCPRASGSLMPSVRHSPAVNALRYLNDTSVDQALQIVTCMPGRGP